jgi:hypothetical protein
MNTGFNIAEAIYLSANKDQEISQQGEELYKGSEKRILSPWKFQHLNNILPFSLLCVSFVSIFFSFLWRRTEISILSAVGIRCNLVTIAWCKGLISLWDYDSSRSKRDYRNFNSGLHYYHEVDSLKRSKFVSIWVRVRLEKYLNVNKPLKGWFWLHEQVSKNEVLVF